MNRAPLALGLLLGTLAAAVVAAGVARDLDRAATQSAEPRIVEADCHLESITEFASADGHAVVICSASLTRPEPSPPMAMTPFVPVVPRNMPHGWEQWTKRLIEMPAVLPGAGKPAVAVKPVIAVKPAVAAPRTAAKKVPTMVQPDLDEAPAVKSQVAMPTRRGGRSPVARSLVDKNRMARILAKYDVADTRAVDELIRQNDGFNDLSESGFVPRGCVAVGRRIVRLEYSGSDDGLGLPWTGELHYGANRRATLHPLDAAAGLTWHVPTAMPGDRAKLWSDDREALIGRLKRAGGAVSDGLKNGLDKSAVIVRLAAAMNRAVDGGWTDLAIGVKRDMWLATFPGRPLTAPVQSAQRQGSGKG